MSAFIVHKDSIDLLVTAVIMAGLRGDRETPSDASLQVIAHADEMGALLWSKNVEAVNRLYGAEQEVPSYEWLPVFELMGLDLTPDQLVQIEKTRRTLQEQSRVDVSWATSPAKRLLDALGLAVAQGLEGWPQSPSTDSGRADYAGIDYAAAAWSRDRGFPSLTRPSGQAQN